MFYSKTNHPSSKLIINNSKVKIKTGDINLFLRLRQKTRLISFRTIHMGAVHVFEWRGIPYSLKTKEKPLRLNFN